MNKMGSKIYCMNVFELARVKLCIAMIHGWKVHMRLSYKIIYKLRTTS